MAIRLYVSKGLDLNRFPKRSLSSLIALNVLEFKFYGFIIKFSLGGGIRCIEMVRAYW